MWVFQKKIFFKTYLKYKNICNKVKKLFASRKSSFIQAWQDFLIFWKIISHLLPRLVVIILIAFFFQILDQILHPFYSFINSKYVLHDDGYVDLLTSVIAGCVILIGLYYAAVMTIASAIYAKAPRELRNLLGHERVGKSYLYHVAYLLIFTSCFLIFYILGCAPNLIATILISFFSCIIVLAFVSLGHRAFNLFDPASLGQEIFVQLKDAAKMASMNTYNWQQQTARNQAIDAIEDLNILSNTILKQKNIDIIALTSLSYQIIYFLCEYEKIKARIPTKSEWFLRYQHYKKWSNSPFLTTELSSAAGMPLPSEVAIKTNFIENNLLKILFKYIDECTHNQKFIIYLGYYLTKVAEEKDAFTSCEIHARLGDKIVNNITKFSPEMLILVDLLGKILIDIMLAYICAINDLAYTKILMRVQSINWLDSKSKYLQGFLQNQLPLLEELEEKIRKEVQVEDIQITPNPYIALFIIKNEAISFKKNFEFLFNGVFSTFQKWLDQMKEHNPWLHAALQARYWEYTDKLEAHLTTTRKIWDDELTQYLDEKEFLKIDFALIKENILKEKDQSMIAMSSLSLEMLRTQAPLNNLPDYPGQFMRCIEDEIINNICNGKFKLIKMIFKTFFCISMLKWKQQFQALKDNSNHVAILGAYAPIEDLMDVCGYIYLFSDFYDDSTLRTEIKETWDSYLKEHNMYPSQIKG